MRERGSCVSLGHGADIDAVDCNGKTAMNIAIEIGNQDLSALLTDYMAWKYQENNAEKNDKKEGVRRDDFVSRFIKVEGWTDQLHDQSKGEQDWEVWRGLQEVKKLLCLL